MDAPLRREMSLRFVTGRPVSEITTQFLAWCCTRLQAQGKTAWLLIWDNATFHVSKIVRSFIRSHNSAVKQEGKGVRILPFFLPTKSPWLHPIEPAVSSMLSVLWLNLMGCSRPRISPSASAPIFTVRWSGQDRERLHLVVTNTLDSPRVPRRSERPPEVP